MTDKTIIGPIRQSLAGSISATLVYWLNFVVQWLTGGVQQFYADAVLAVPLPAGTYANGTSGLGATFTVTASGVFPTPDGVTPFKGMKILVTHPTDGANCGYYDLTTLGTSTTSAVLTRSTPFDTSAEMLHGTQFLIRNGTSHGGKVWEFTGASLPTVGSTALTFAGTVQRSVFRGSIPASRLAFSANPVNLDVFAIGGVTFKYVTALAAATTFVQIKVLGTAALSLASTVNAINGITDANVVDASTPFPGLVFADAVSATVLRIRNAAVRGGRPVPGVAATTALTASITAGAAAWTIANLNQYGKADTENYVGTSDPITITAPMITAGELEVEFPFTPKTFIVTCRTSAGVLRSASDVAVISGDAVKITLGGGASPNMQATDVITVEARS